MYKVNDQDNFTPQKHNLAYNHLLLHTSHYFKNHIKPMAIIHIFKEAEDLWLGSVFDLAGLVCYEFLHRQPQPAGTLSFGFTHEGLIFNQDRAETQAFDWKYYAVGFDSNN